MRTVQNPARWDDVIAGLNQWTTIVDWSNDGGITWHTAPFVDGTVTADAGSQWRWHCDLHIREDRVGLDGINPFNTRIRVRHGVQWSSAERDRELLGMGIYRVSAASRGITDPGLLSVSGDSFEQYLINARFSSPRRFFREDATDRLAQLITEVLPNASIYWDRVNARVLPAVTVERERWETIDGGSSAGSIARALGARVYCNGDGVFIVGTVPTLDDSEVWSADVGAGGVLINSTEELTNDSVYNRIVVTGESTEEDIPPVGPAIAQDEDPYSPTYIRKTPDMGGFGVCPKFYTSQLITTFQQAAATARSMLAPSLGLRQSITFDSLHDPRKEPGDVGIVTTPSGTKQRVILDSVTYNLLGEPLSCETRTTRAAPGGQTADSGTDDEGEE